MSLALSYWLPAATPEDVANTVILDETGEKNLRIETVEAEETSFEDTAFMLGRVEAIPERRAVTSSRISGRIIELKTALGAQVEANAEVVKLESRQAGDPPPSIWLRAPASGIITEATARLGEPVEPDRAILEITDLTEVYATARVPEHVAGKLAVGTEAHILVVAASTEPLEAKLLRFGTSADVTKGTVDAIFQLPNAALKLRPGMRAEFTLVLGKRDGVMTIPRLALQGDAMSRVVYRKHYDESLKHTFVKVPVQVGAINERFVEITNGLLAGDEVVTTGAYSLAFAGKGSVSLKAALDAAHGHEHNEDGSEMTAGQKAQRSANGHEHEHDDEHSSGLTRFSLACNVLLLVLLVVAMRRKPAIDKSTSAAT